MLYVDWFIAVFAALLIFVVLAQAHVEWRAWRRRRDGDQGPGRR